MDNVPEVIAPASTAPSTAVATSRLSLPSTNGMGGPTCMPKARGEVAFSVTERVCGGPGGRPTTVFRCFPPEAISTMSVTGQGMPFCTRRRIVPSGCHAQVPCAGASTSEGAGDGLKVTATSASPSADLRGVASSVASRVVTCAAADGWTRSTVAAGAATVVVRSSSGR